MSWPKFLNFWHERRSESYLLAVFGKNSKDEVLTDIQHSRNRKNRLFQIFDKIEFWWYFYMTYNFWRFLRLWPWKNRKIDENFDFPQNVIWVTSRVNFGLWTRFEHSKKYLELSWGLNRRSNFWTFFEKKFSFTNH